MSLRSSAPFNPIITLTGSGATINDITGMWDGREVRVFMVDGTNTFGTAGSVGTKICGGGGSFDQFETALLYKVPGANCISVK